MKKILLLLVFALISVSSYAATGFPVSSNTVANALSGDFIKRTNGVAINGLVISGGNLDVGAYLLKGRDAANIFISGSPTNNVNGTFSYATNIIDVNGTCYFYTNNNGYTLRINAGSTLDDVVDIVTNGAPYPPLGVLQSVFTAHDPIRTGVSVSVWAYGFDGSTVTGMTSYYKTNETLSINSLFHTNFADSSTPLIARFPTDRMPNTLIGQSVTGATNGTGTTYTIAGGPSTGTGRGGPVVLKTSLSSTVSSAVENLQATRFYLSAKETVLTEASATKICTITLATGKTIGIRVLATTRANDATDFTVHTDEFVIGAINKAGTITAAISTIATATTATGGSAASTLTTTWTVVDDTGGVLSIKNNAVASLTQTILNCQWRLEIDGNDTAVTVTPQ